MTEMRKQKRVLAISDISCFGKCSLTVALPVISSAGLECTVLPNVLLSAHTGIGGFTFRDLTSEMRKIMDHWESIGLGFDTIYTGFLGNREQIDVSLDAIRRFRNDETMIFVDPAMADDGKLYPVFGPDFPACMRRLCSEADIIKPNVTEACLMLGEECDPGPHSEEFVERLLSGLSGFCPGKIILTGVRREDGRMGAAAADREAGITKYFLHETVPGSYCGTGDIFSSAAVGAMTRGIPFFESAEIAVGFTYGSIRRTYLAGTDPLYGADFEEEIPDFIARLGK